MKHAAIAVVVSLLLVAVAGCGNVGGNAGSPTLIWSSQHLPHANADTARVVRELDIATTAKSGVRITFYFENARMIPVLPKGVLTTGTQEIGFRNLDLHAALPDYTGPAVRRILVTMHGGYEFHAPAGKIPGGKSFLEFVWINPPPLSGSNGSVGVGLDVNQDARLSVTAMPKKAALQVIVHNCSAEDCPNNPLTPFP